jgi:hypothetical protein
MPKVKTKAAINVPDQPDKTAVTILGDKIIFVTIEYDSDTPNPCTDCDGMGHVRSLSSRHINHIDYEEAKQLLEDDPDVIPLSYFEHGNCVWMVMNGATSNTPGIEFRWDGVRFAGVWIPDDCVRESYTGQDGLSRRDWMAKQAENCCATYTQWANGECYYFRIGAYKLRTDEDTGDNYEDEDDYRFKDELEEDCCGGFIGWDWALQATQEAAESILAQLKG